MFVGERTSRAALQPAKALATLLVLSGERSSSKAVFSFDNAKRLLCS